MNRMTSALLCSALAAFALTGCTSESEPAAVSQPASTPGEPSSETLAPATPTTINTQGGVISKSIGEAAGFGCDPALTRDDCDVQFKVTSITRGETCPSYGTGPGPDEEIVRFELEVATQPAFNYQQSESVLLIQNWSTIGADGFMQKNPDVATGCAVVDTDAVYQFLEPGTKQRASVPVIAPKGSTTLRLFSSGSGLEWPIPA